MIGEGVKERPTLLLASETDGAKDHRFRDRSPCRASDGIGTGDPRKPPHLIIARHVRQASLDLSWNENAFRVYISEDLWQIVTDRPTIPREVYESLDSLPDLRIIHMRCRNLSDVAAHASKAAHRTDLLRAALGLHVSTCHQSFGKP